MYDELSVIKDKATIRNWITKADTFAHRSFQKLIKLTSYLFHPQFKGLMYLFHAKTNKYKMELEGENI